MPAKGSGTGTGSVPREIRVSCGVTTIAVVLRAAIRTRELSVEEQQCAGDAVGPHLFKQRMSDGVAALCGGSIASTGSSGDLRECAHLMQFPRVGVERGGAGVFGDQHTARPPTPGRRTDRRTAQSCARPTNRYQETPFIVMRKHRSISRRRRHYCTISLHVPRCGDIAPR
jgi:hypothetical protein